jgi:hypothetical protein
MAANHLQRCYNMTFNPSHLLKALSVYWKKDPRKNGLENGGINILYTVQLKCNVFRPVNYNNFKHCNKLV